MMPTKDLTPAEITAVFPSPIAINFATAIDEDRSWQERIDACFTCFEVGVRSLVLGLLAGYVDQSKMVDDARLMSLLRRLDELQLTVWINLFNTSMQAYKGLRTQFFVPELYDAYWEESAPTMSQQIDELRRLRAQTDAPRDEEFFDQVFGELVRLLNSFKFLSDYNLIRIDTLYPDKRCQYTVFRGTQPQTLTSTLPTSVTSGWVYLVHQQKRFLKMYPFVVGATAFDDLALMTEKNTDDLGLLGSYFSDSGHAFYIMYALQQFAETNRTVEALHRFAEWLANYSERQLEQDKRDELTWDNLRQITADMSDERMAATREKYFPDVYVERQSVATAFQDFLNSAYTGFVLIGKSGVGKSNFVIANVGEVYGTSDDTVVIMLDGGQLENADVLETVYRELARKIKLDREKVDPYMLVDRISDLIGTTSRRVIIVIDAINENANAVNIMQTINGWTTRARKEYPWMRFVVTSRPQAWRNIRQGCHGFDTQAYFQPESRSDIAFELSGFEVQMSEFEVGSELKSAYEKYATRYSVDTQLQELSANIREALRDPLILKLLMETYGNDVKPDRKYQLPLDIDLATIIEKYVAQLRDRNMVRASDFDLLTQKIVPLLCTDGKYANFTTREEITRRHPELVDAIFDDSVITMLDGSRQQINQAFERLKNAEILTRQKRSGTGKKDEIRFKYERFYDYFIANYLREQYDSLPLNERKRVYLDLVALLPQSPFLWGPLYMRLLDECRQGDINLLYEMAFVDNSRVKDLVVTVLVDFGTLPGNGEKAPDKTVEALCHQILDALPLSEKLEPRFVTAGMVAMQVAEILRFGDVISDAMLKPHDFIADVAVDILANWWTTDRITHEYNKRDVEFAYISTLETISMLRIVRWRQFRKTIRSLILLTLTVYINEYLFKNNQVDAWKDVTTKLNTVLNALVKKLPLLGLFRGSAAGSKMGFATKLKRGALRIIANFAVYAATRVTQGGNFVFDLKAVSRFFELSSQERLTRYGLFIPQITSQNPDAILEALHDPTRKLIHDDQLIGSYIGVAPLIAALKNGSDQVNTFILEQFEYAFTTLGRTTQPEKSAGSIHLANLLIILRNTMIETHGVELTSKKLANFEYVVRKVEDQFWSRFQSFSSTISWFDLAVCFYFTKQLKIQPDFSILREMTVQRLQRHDYKSLGRYLHDIMVVGWHPMATDIELAFDMLSTVLRELPTEQILAHKDILIEDLIHIRTVNEYRTDIFLEEPIAHKLGDEIRHTIRTSQPRYDIGDRLGGAVSWFARFMMLDDDASMRHYMRWFLELALISKDEREWMARVIEVALEGVFSGKLPDVSTLTVSPKLN